jgi:uroporphyrinogen-III decarboxylase
MYDFDGILIHKPGREEQVLEIAKQEEFDGGVDLIFPDGGKIRCRHDDDPVYLPPGEYKKATIEDVDHLNLTKGLPPSMQHWWINCGLLELQSHEDVPSYWFSCIDLVHEAIQDESSVHGEVNSPFDSIFHVLDFDEVLMGLITHPEKIHALLGTLTEISTIWAVAQIRRGCDAIKLSSPWAGKAFISRDHYKEFVLTYESRIVEAVRNEGGIIYTHTCGSISDRLDLIVASGVDGIECLDPPPLGDINLGDAVAKWGDQIFIKGNVDSVNTLLTKSTQHVRMDAEQRLTIGSQGKGFILSTACSIAPYVPPENVLALVSAARSYQDNISH